jgi:predicted small lipoprotein YifL
MGLLVAAAVLLLTACGQKGPLYRPDEAPDAESGNQAAAAPSQVND